MLSTTLYLFETDSNNNAIGLTGAPVKNVFDCVKNNQNGDLSEGDCVTKCSLMTRVDKATVYRILREEEEGGIDSPKKRPGRKELQLTDNTKQAVRRIVHDFFMEKTIPTLDMILWLRKAIKK